MMRAAIVSSLAALFALASAPVMSDRLGIDDSREILSELRKINENLEKINKYLDGFDRELQSKQRAPESERIFRELNEILREQKTRPQTLGPNGGPADFNLR